MTEIGNTQAGGIPAPAGIVLIQSDYFNAMYEDGRLVRDGKPERLDTETLANLFPAAQIYVMGDDVYGELLNGSGYPPELATVPLGRCRRYR